MKNNRKRKVIKPQFQFRMFGLMLLIILFLWVSTLIFIYSFTIREISKIHGDEEIIMNFLNTFSIYIVISLVVVIFLTTLLNIHLSHRIAGPIFRIETVLRELKKRIIPEVFHVRSNDDPEFILISELLNDHLKDFKDFYNSSKNLTLILDKIVADNVVDKTEMELMKRELFKFEHILDTFKFKEEDEELE